MATTMQASQKLDAGWSPAADVRPEDFTKFIHRRMAERKFDRPFNSDPSKMGLTGVITAVVRPKAASQITDVVYRLECGEHRQIPIIDFIGTIGGDLDEVRFFVQQD